MDTKAAFDREAFETWYCNTKGVDKYWIEDRRCEPNSYILGENVLIYWECWKASREAIEIELPKAGDYFIDEDEATLFDALIVDIELNLKSNGIRIKGKTE